jgi:hypothetical protein
LLSTFLLYHTTIWAMLVSYMQDKDNHSQTQRPG